MKKIFSVVALLLVIVMCASLTALAADDDKTVYLAKDQSSVESKQLAWTSAKVIAYNSSSSAHDVEMLLRRSAGDGYYTVARGVIPPDQYWNCISDNGNEWALYRLKMSVVDGSNGCVAGAHVQQSEYEEEWE